MGRIHFRLLAALALVTMACPVAAQEAQPCDLCFGGQTRQGEIPLRIEIVSGIDFSRLALTGDQDGSAALDPQTGHRQTDRGLIDLGGMAFQGRAKVSGEAMRQVRIELPQRVTLEIVETEPVVRGQTAASSFKTAILSNGVKTMVPPHIETGTRVVVMTADASYVERAKD